ncbi:MAG: PEP-CTERM sorting domain-containing protein [Akkermansia sp.]|nr:PEP-CTERM sorting domain-containing protein [Akkermansia sp.]
MGAGTPAYVTSELAGTVFVDKAVAPSNFILFGNGATITAAGDWFTESPEDTVELDGINQTNKHVFNYTRDIKIADGAQVTFNTHHYSADAAYTQDASHVMHLLGNMTGQNVHLIFKNEQISAGADNVTQEEGGLGYTGDAGTEMGYVAIKDIHQFTGDITVKNKTVLQVSGSKDSDTSAVNATIDGTDAAMQILDSAPTQYVNKLTVRNTGALLLGGGLKSDNGTGASAQKTVDYEGVQMSVTNRYEGTDGGTMSNVHTGLTGSAASIGGSSSAISQAQNVHITAHTGGVIQVHDTHLASSLVELKNSASLYINDIVYIDKDSLIMGQAALEASVTNPTGALSADFATVVPAAATETANTGATTTVELTVSGGTVYQHGNATVYHVTANQFQNVNVDGTGLTIKLTDTSFLDKAGVDVVAVQISGIGQFRYEYTAGFIETANWQLFDANGTDITHLWMTSADVEAVAGVATNSHMLYFKAVPEPTTATLSLLALAALAARRRRK